MAFVHHEYAVEPVEIHDREKPGAKTRNINPVTLGDSPGAVIGWIAHMEGFKAAGIDECRNTGLVKLMPQDALCKG